MSGRLADRVHPRTPTARNAPRPGRSRGSPISAAPAASVSRSRRRRSRLRHETEAERDPSPRRVVLGRRRLRRHCLRRARVRCRRRRRRGLTRRGRSLGIPQRSQRNAEREDGPGGVVLRRPTGRVGGDRGRRQRARSAPCRSSPSRPPWSWTPWSVQCRSSRSRSRWWSRVASSWDSVTVVVDADVVPGDVSVGLGRVGSVTDPVGRVTLLSGGSRSRRLRNHQGGNRNRGDNEQWPEAQACRSCATAGSRSSVHRAHRGCGATRRAEYESVPWSFQFLGHASQANSAADAAL